MTEAKIVHFFLWFRVYEVYANNSVAQAYPI